MRTIQELKDSCLPAQTKSLLLSSTSVKELEKLMLDMPQVDCPVTHHFGPGLYIREMFIPADCFIIGHFHNDVNMNIMLKGHMILRSDDGSIKELKAPLTFTNGPGRKLAYIIEDVIFQNVYATEETNLEKLEEMLITKSEAWLTFHNKSEVIECHGEQ